ncbi:tetratricopeptide repeat protein [Pyxidicoccus xibeiensis]|uniref:tetratricopeptide repeat protein n=1 Tax=Pyxidicoccus xibeiensis TaxID=2906759 RepID=UPI0020A7623C|nr:tetratricopeptide repeat protein [Pyxidicoccus xibeiensis]MCP3143900.1 serine/threonine-protein kinase [Pyxidicoccus xibeiensis]
MACLDESTFMELLLGTLPHTRAAKVDAHLDACPACRRMVAEALRAQSPDEGPPGEATALTPPRPAGAEERPLEKGTAVGRYLVLERLGAGGMGVVYSAYDPELDRRVALKLLRVGVLGLDAEEGRAHLLREAQAMARVSHPHVVPIYDVGTFGQNVFLAMELVEAQTLRQWLKAAPRPWRQVLGLFLDAGRGLAAAHAAGVVHGDFKPENLLVGRDGRVRVTDFGLARSANPPGDETPSTPVAGGTPAYMSPEQLDPDSHPDERSDQFSFCVALYEALHGERPFAASTVRELLLEVRNGKVRPAPRNSPVPPWLRRVVVRGLSVSPMDRHGSMDALLSALQQDPAARRKRTLQVAGSAALLVAAVGITHAVGSRREQVCAGAQEALATVWGPTQQGAIQSAFLATGKPFASAAWQRVRRTLDVYTAEWVTTRTTACEATRVRREQPEEVLARRMHCLDGRLAEVAALTQLFARADAGTVELAARAAEALPPLQHCSDLAALAAREPVPVDADARTQSDALRQSLVRARALKAAGKYAEAVALLEPVAKTVKASGDRFGAASVLLLLGELREELGDLRGSEATLFEAVWAAEAGRNDMAAARAWTALVHTSGELLEQYSLAWRWRERAEAAIERLGGDASLRAKLQVRTGALLFAQGRYTEAAEQQEAALARLEQTYGPDSLEAADVRLGLGSTRVAQHRVDDALKLFERALETRRQALGPDHPDVARAQLDVAHGYWRQANLPRVEELSRTALAVFERALGTDHPDVSRALNQLAAVVERQGQGEEALRLQERALDITIQSEGLESAGTQITLSNLANLLARLGRHEEALARHMSTIAPLEQRLGPQHPFVARAYRACGNNYRDMKRFKEAHPYLLKAQAILESRQDDPYGYRAGIWVDLGRNWLDLGHPRKAAELLELAVANRSGSKQSATERAYSRFFLARALWEANLDRPRALQLAREARRMLLGMGERYQKVVAELDAWHARLPRPATVPAASTR